MDFGTGVTSVYTVKDRSFDMPVWPRGRPLHESDLNIAGQIQSESLKVLERSKHPSGWFLDSENPENDYYFSPYFSNLFYFGRGSEGTEESPVNVLYASVNGWTVPVTGTRVNNGSLNDNDFRNKIELPFAPTTGYDLTFVFLEVWQTLVEYNSTSHKPSSTTVYKYGNTEFGGTNPTQEFSVLSSVALSKRIQTQYRIRVVAGVDLLSYPTGFADSSVYARTSLSTGAAFDLAGSLDTTFYSQSLAGDAGLWRAGDGDPDNGLGTIDGYSYAIPICVVSRRNRSGYSLSNQNGAVSRRSVPEMYVEGVQNGDIFTDEEYSELPQSDRPDSLFADYIISQDVTDLRHDINPADYDHLLKKSLFLLKDNDLRTTWKLSTIGGSQVSSKILHTDEINGTGVDNPNTVLIGKADGVRRIFSDVLTYQPAHESVVIGSKESSSPSYGSNPSRWMPGDVFVIDHPAALSSASYPSKMSDLVRVTYGEGTLPIVEGSVTSSTNTTLTSSGSFTLYSGTASQFKGYAVKILTGTGAGQIRTINSITSSNQISIYTAWTTNPSSGDYFEIVAPVVECSMEATDSEMTVTIDSINGVTSTSSSDIQSADLTRDLWVDYLMVYPQGQGLSLVADTVHEINYTNPTSTVLVSTPDNAGYNYLDVQPLSKCSAYSNSTLNDSTLSKTLNTSAYADGSSKTVVIQPFQRVEFDVSPRTLNTFTPSHSYYGLFDVNLSFDLPKRALPPIGYHSIPILSTENASPVFFSGLIGWLFDETGETTATSVHVLGRTDFDDDTYEGSSVFARSDSIDYEEVDSGTPDKIGLRINPLTSGLEFPNYIGISRVIAVFESDDFTSNGLEGTNLLNSSTTGPTLWIGKSTGNTDVTFTVLPGAVTDFDEGLEYIVVANVFGYREGFIGDNGYVCCHEQVTGVSPTVTLRALLAEPLPSSAIVQITYTRTVYQGDIYANLDPYAGSSPEPYNNRGRTSPGDLDYLDSVLTSYNTANTSHFQVLSTANFVTSLGTGRFSGNPVKSLYDIDSVTLDVSDPNFSRLSMGGCSPESLGFTSRLPLGARYKDSDFVGDLIESSGVRGSFVFLGDTQSSPGNVIDTGVSKLLAPGQIITMTQGKNADFATLDQYRTTRGGSGYLRSETEYIGPLNTGELAATLGHAAIYGTVALVKTFTETHPIDVEAEYDPEAEMVEKGVAGELQMLVVTHAVSNPYNVSGRYTQTKSDGITSPSGHGEGYTAVDRYRIPGRPLEHQKLRIFLDPDVSFTSSRATTPELYVYKVEPGEVQQYDLLKIHGTGFFPSSDSVLSEPLQVQLIYQSHTDTIVDVSRDILYVSDSLIGLKVPSLDTGNYVVRVTNSVGRSFQTDQEISVVSSVSNSEVVYSNENFNKVPNRSRSLLSGVLTSNAANVCSILSDDSYLLNSSLRFKARNLVSSQSAQYDLSNDANYGTGTSTVSVRFAFKVPVSVPTSNTLYIKFQVHTTGTTFADLFDVVQVPSTSYYTFTLSAGINGGSSTTVVSTVPIDTEWHTTELVVSWNGSSWDRDLYLDDVLIDSGTASGTIIDNDYEPRRLTISNTVSSGFAKATAQVDSISIQNFAVATTLASVGG